VETIGDQRAPRVWRLGDRTLDFPPPLAAGIVNVNTDSFFRGARSGTPEQAAADGFAAADLCG
jgi:hypothetical protein